MTSNRRYAPLVLVLALGCGVEGGAGDVEPGTAHVASPIVRGSDSAPDQDAVVLVMHYDALKVGGGSAGCTGTLLTPRLVLTARHCIAETDESAACDSEGNATFGAEVRADHLPTKLYAFAGAQRPDYISGLDRAARGAEIIDDGSKTLCNHDIALVLLDRALPGGKIAPVRLEGGPRKDEIVRAIGWGVTDKTANPATRQQRGGVKVLGVGPGERLGPAEFKVGESVCAGDSGGPAMAESSGAVLGVLSRGGNNRGATPGDPQGCLGSENVFTSAASYKDLILSAYAKAGQVPWREGEPDPTTLPGGGAVSPEAESGSGCALAPHLRSGEAGRRPEGHPDQPARPGSVLACLALVAMIACVARRAPRS